MARVFFAGGGALFPIMKRAMVKKDYKEIDETIKAKVAPFLYNNGDGAMVPIAQMAYVRNRDRSERKMVSEDSDSLLKLYSDFFS